MSNGPEVVDDTIAPGWRLTRWQYDGARLVGERRHPSGAGYDVEIDNVGDLAFDGLPYEGARPYVPAAVLRALVADAFARGTPGWQLPTDPVTPLTQPAEGASDP